MKISRERYAEIQNAAACCFEFFGTRNPLAVLKEMEIPCSYIKLDGDLKGFTNVNDKDEPWVYINSKYDRYSAKIIAAHELGHIILHRSNEINMFEDDGVSSETEYEANIFLMEFMPQTQPHDKNYITLTPTQLKNYICSKIH
nr:ImmA/IrrE family metallo-endopeptidase [uncultured Acetatifactor sp.]